MANASAPPQSGGYASSEIFFTFFVFARAGLFNLKGKENFAFGVLLFQSSGRLALMLARAGREFIFPIPLFLPAPPSQEISGGKNWRWDFADKKQKKRELRLAHPPIYAQESPF